MDLTESSVIYMNDNLIVIPTSPHMFYSSVLFFTFFICSNTICPEIFDKKKKK
jgi:hypothetical protein